MDLQPFTTAVMNCKTVLSAFHVDHTYPILTVSAVFIGRVVLLCCKVLSYETGVVVYKIHVLLPVV